MDTAPRYQAGQLLDHAAALLRHAGLAEDRARIMATVLVEGDLLGHTTHGLALLPGYLGELASGAMAATGDPAIVSERKAVATWDGGKLPGPWLTWRACDEAAKRAADYGTGTIVIRRSHHIACLAAYLERVTAQNMICIIESSDPAVVAVAAHGGTKPLFTPNPIAIGLPTGGDPILVDVSCSITTMGMARRQQKAGASLPGEWLLDSSGTPTADPGALDSTPPGSLMLLGGREAGHKGFGLALMIEALTSGLGGFGRAEGPTGWGASVFVQVLDPEAFGGLGDFRRQIDHMVEACQASPPIDPANPVRMPGHRGLARKRAALAEGVELHPGIVEALAPWAEKTGVGALVAR
jgi:LDH2 family malate/lactate/ureidoglycolate dehydrogenase